MENKILNIMIKRRKGHYCHCVEVSSVEELEMIGLAVYDEFEEDFGADEVVDFLESLSVYSLDDENEEEIYGFSFMEYIKWEVER